MFGWLFGKAQPPARQPRRRRNSAGRVVPENLFEALRFRSVTASEITALIEAGADARECDENGVTLLHEAAKRGADPSKIAALIKGGANPNARTVDGLTPLHVAADLNSSPSVIMALIEGGADPAAIDIDGFTPFDYAQENERLRGTDAYWRLSDARFE